MRDASSAGESVRPRTLVSLLSGDYRGLWGRAVDVQVDLCGRSSPAFTIVGLPGKSTRESRDRIRAAIQNSGFQFPRARILVNLAPASQEKQGCGFDLAVALGILLGSGQVAAPGREILGERLARTAFLGELGLEGELRAVRGALLVCDALSGRGVREFVVPEENGEEVALLGRGGVHAVKNLREALAALAGGAVPRAAERPLLRGAPDLESAADDLDFADVRGQEATKRGILIAAAGGHNVLLCGPPGVGKTMLARRIPGILTPLSTAEAMEVLRVRSAAGGDGPVTLSRARPFRAPHHTVSYAGLVGGGSDLAPGEVTRAHQGVLFLDEFPEFSRRALEALREPLEAGCITIGRSSGAVTFPARFLLVAAMNPCPCGYLGHPRRECRCTERQIQAYRQRISGPLEDRLDLFLPVAPLEPARVLGTRTVEGELDSQEMRRLVARARREQEARWGTGTTNSRVSLRRLLAEGSLSPGALQALRAHAERLSLSGRAFARTLRVARTIADTEGLRGAGERCVLEAFQYRRT